MNKPAAFPMLEVLQLPPKPRKNCMILMSEVGIPLRATEDIIEIAAPIIDYAKITDHAGLADRRANGGYDHGVFHIGVRT